jgi:hypothetical protein
MENFPNYERRVEIDRGALKSLVAGEKGELSAMDATAKAIKEFTKREDDMEESIHRSRYQNLVLESAARAYKEHPTDIDGYRNAIRESLRDYPIPPARRQNYAAILYNGEARYFHAILSGKVNSVRDEENAALLSLADSYYRDGIGTLSGNLPPAADGELGTQAAGDEYLEALSLATAAGNNGDPQAMERVNGYAMGALESHARNEMELADDPAAAMEQYVTGEKDVEAIIPTSGGPIGVSSAPLPDEYRTQLRDNISEDALRLIEKRKDKELLDSGIRIMDFPATYRGTSDDRKSLDMVGKLHLTMHPLSPETFPTHMRNMMIFAKKFKYIPDGYVGEINARINGLKDGYSAAAWSSILQKAMENGGESIAAQFPKDTILRASLIHDLVTEEGMEPQEALGIINGLQGDAPRWENAMEMNKYLIKESKKIYGREDYYGTKVTPEKYGDLGVNEYERMFRSFYLTNGNNISNARKVAKECLDAVYGTTRLGYYGKGWWNRRKVKYPPEAYYPSSVVRDGVARTLRDVVIPYLRDNMGYHDISNDNYMLVANDATVRAFYDRGSDSPSPSWELWYVTPHGGRIPVFDDNGKVVTYSLDGGASVMDDNDRRKYDRNLHWNMDALNDWERDFD